MQQNIGLVIKAIVLFTAIGVAYYFIFQKYDEASAQVSMIKEINAQNDIKIQEELKIQDE